MKSKKKSPRKSPKKEYISERAIVSQNRLYLDNRNIPKESKLKVFFDNIHKKEQQIVSLDLSGKDLKLARKFNHKELQHNLYYKYSYRSIRILTLENCNLVGKLDLRYLHNLSDLSVKGNKFLKNIFLPESNKINKVRKLDISGTAIQALGNLNKNIIEELRLNNTRFEILILNDFKKIRMLECQECNISQLEVYSNPELRKLVFSFNSKLENVFLENNINLRYLKCEYCSLNELDLKNMINITELYCAENKIKTLDISMLTKLKHLDCYNNQIEILETKDLIELQILDCTENKIRDLEITK